MNAAAFLAALLALLPVPAARRACIVARRDAIIAQADAAALADGVPVGVLLVVAFLESHIGCAPRSGACWGAPIDPRHRQTAGNARSASRALAWGYRRCHTTLGAISHFRSGRCVSGRLVGYRPEDAVRLLDRVTARAAGVAAAEAATAAGAR